ncbi:MAG: phosphomethylpyrimidine kinase [Desulfuromonas sp.]|uniref:bifunctional hydroxymethylpyrimidine kinase/phosphomethylpyrimidine kinase n=1 Tax=Desulfuromonas sp. TaxID=892 RepID=UPI000CB7F31A|nr:bifunctional hydroxymethylpyrimidine kinase/phosphomethylpyrimidine kinase [Desulfuromonas sp.]PLX85936.1 MAG: phosphomethylpyrimidine kinase [Desulfuromonas sp.]
MISGLYIITDGDEDGRLAERTRAAIAGGARIVQYRDKGRPEAEKLAAARRIGEICRRSGATYIVNDSPQLAREAGADGVHLGQGDGTVAAAREILGPKGIVGVSTRTAEQARAAQAQGANYIGLGSMFPTATKDDAVHVGVDRLRQVRREVALPIVAIGGIDREGACEVIDAGADAVAVVSAVMADPDPALAAREIALLFNRIDPLRRARVLTVAGSDSGGGAGIQADLKTVSLLGGYGASAITALTAQNTLGVHGIHPVPAGFVAEQIETVLSDIGADAVKTGMLLSAEIIRATARALAERHLPIVVDPVMIAKGGAALLQDEAIAALLEELLPLTYLLTPNLPEAQALTGIAVTDEAGMEKAARRLQEMGARNVLLKGGHLEGEAVDLLLEGGRVRRYAAPRLETPNTHGTGCTYAAAVATCLAGGEPLPVAVAKAKTFITEAIRTALPLGSGHGPVNHWEAANTLRDDRPETKGFQP